MKEYKIILFDLDGTLIDSGMGITNSVAYSLDKFGIKPEGKEVLYKFIGPPLAESFIRYFGFSKEKAQQAIEYYREYYREKGIFENLIYKGVRELLENLQAAGKTLMVATAKPEIFAKEILRHYKLAEHFVYIAGSKLDGTRVHKTDVIQYALKTNKIYDMSSVIMIGDREHDIIGARKFGIDSIGVLYGFGDREELEAAEPTYMVENAYEIEDILLAKKMA